MGGVDAFVVKETFPFLFYFFILPEQTLAGVLCTCQSLMNWGILPSKSPVDWRSELRSALRTNEIAI